MPPNRLVILVENTRDLFMLTQVHSPSRVSMCVEYGNIVAEDASHSPGMGKNDGG